RPPPGRRGRTPPETTRGSSLACRAPAGSPARPPTKGYREAPDRARSGHSAGQPRDTRVLSCQDRGAERVKAGQEYHAVRWESMRRKLTIRHRSVSLARSEERRVGKERRAAW